MKSITLLSALLLFFAFSSAAQTMERKVINTIGQEYSASHTILKVSVGEPLVGHKGTSVRLSQGFFTSNAVASPNSIPEVKIDNAVIISPNPTIDIIYFKRPADESLSVEMVNVLGQVVRAREMMNVYLSLADIPAGIYIVRIYNREGNAIQSSKIIKQ